jgi:hypothetical protein
LKKKKIPDSFLGGLREYYIQKWLKNTKKNSLVLGGISRGRPFANAANSYLEFTAGISQKFGCWANIWAFIEKSEKLTICMGNSAPLKTFLLKILKKFDFRFF